MAPLAGPVLQTVEANAALIPPQGKGSLYLRPLLVGSGPILGLGPAPSYTLVSGRAQACFHACWRVGASSAGTVGGMTPQRARPPARSCQVVYCAAVGAYFKGGQLTPIDLIVETRFHRAAPGGMGGTKCAGNYSPVLVTQVRGMGGRLGI